MDNWVYALLLKFASLLLLAFLYYVFVYKFTRLIGRFIPNGKVKEFLFRERGDTRSSTGRDLQ